MKSFPLIIAITLLSVSKVYSFDKEYYLFPDLLFKINCSKWTEEDNSYQSGYGKYSRIKNNSIRPFTYYIKSQYTAILEENHLVQTFDWYNYTNNSIELYKLNSKEDETLNIERTIYTGNSIDSLIDSYFRKNKNQTKENTIVNKLNFRIAQETNTYKKWYSDDSSTTYNQYAFYFKAPYLYSISISSSKNDFKKLKQELIAILNTIQTTTPKQIDTKLKLPFEKNLGTYKKIKEDIVGQYTAYFDDLLKNTADSFIYLQTDIREIAKNVFETKYKSENSKTEAKPVDPLIEDINKQLQKIESDSFNISEKGIDSIELTFNKIPNQEFNPFKDPESVEDIRSLKDHFDSIPFKDVVQYLKNNKDILKQELEDTYIDNETLDRINDEYEDELANEDAEVVSAATEAAVEVEVEEVLDDYDEEDETDHIPSYSERDKPFAFIRDEENSVLTNNFSFSDYYAAEQKLIKGNFTLNDYFSFLTQFKHPKNNIFSTINTFSSNSYDFENVTDEFVEKKLNATVFKNYKIENLRYLSYEKTKPGNDAPITDFWFVAKVATADTSNHDGVLLKVSLKNNNYQITSTLIKNYFSKGYYYSNEISFPDNIQQQYVILENYNTKYIGLRNNIQADWIPLKIPDEIYKNYTIITKNCSFVQNGCGEGSTYEMTKGDHEDIFNSKNDMLQKLYKLKESYTDKKEAVLIDYYKTHDSTINEISYKIDHLKFPSYLDFIALTDTIGIALDLQNQSYFEKYFKYVNQYSLYNQIYNQLLKKEKRLYVSNFVFDDLDGDGNMEIIVMAVSDGKLIYYDIYTNNKSEIKKYNNPNAEVQLKNTIVYKEFIKLSLKKQNSYYNLNFNIESYLRTEMRY